MEYSAILLAHLPQKLLKKFTHIETSAIKIALQLPPWMPNAWCYHYYSNEAISTRLKTQAKQFLTRNGTDPLISGLMTKPSFFVKSAQFWD
jgi:hypothetical protein